MTDGGQGEAGRAAEGGGEDAEEEFGGNKCVVLKDSFPISPGVEGGDAPVDYFFWQVRHPPPFFLTVEVWGLT